MANHKETVLSEVNTMRKAMNLPLINENELLHLELSKIDLDSLNEGWWQNIKYALSKLGRYKAGGKVFGKSKTDAAANSKILALLNKQGNELIKALDMKIKEISPEFPNNKDEGQFLDIVIEIGKVYDSIVAATKLQPDEEGFLPVDAANTIIGDLVEYIKKFLDVDLKAAYSVFTEGEEMGMEPDPRQSAQQMFHALSDESYSPQNEMEKSALRRMMSDGLVDYDSDVDVDNDNVHHGSVDFFWFTAAGHEQVRSAEDLIPYLDYSYEGGNDSETPYLMGRELDEADPNLQAKRADVAGRAAGAKDAIKSGDMQAYDSERMKTLGSNKLPATLLALGSAMGAFGFITHSEWFKSLFQSVHATIDHTFPKIVEQNTNVLSSIKNGDGVYKFLGQITGKPLNGTESPQDFIKALAQLGNGDANAGVDALCQQNGVMMHPAEAAKGLKHLVANPDKYQSISQFFQTGTGTSGTGKVAPLNSTLYGTISGGSIKTALIKAVTTAVARGGAKLALKTGAGYAAAKGLGAVLLPLGIALVAGAAAVKLARWKGKKSSRAQVMNDLMQTIRPVPPTPENQNVLAGGEANMVADPNANGGKTGGNMGGEDQLFTLIKKYFQDLFNFKSQTNQDTYGKVAQANQPKNYTGGGQVTKKLTQPNDINDILKLMEGFDIVDEAAIEQIGLSQNQLKLFKTNVNRLTMIVKTINKINTQDKNLAGLLAKAKGNPISQMDVNTLLNSDEKSLGIFVSNFNKSLYSTQFKNGNNIMDQLKLININKINESAVRQEPKGVMNKIVNDRRMFLSNLPAYLNTMYAIFSYLIDSRKKAAQAPKPAAQPATKPQSAQAQAARQPMSMNEDDALNEMIVAHNDLMDIIAESDSINTILTKYKVKHGVDLNRIKIHTFIITEDLNRVEYGRMIQELAPTDMKKVQAMQRNLDSAESEYPEPNQQFNPQQFMPDKVDRYDLSSVPQAARIALSEKAAQIISRNNDIEMSAASMMSVLKQLCYDINQNGQKRIPTI